MDEKLYTIKDLEKAFIAGEELTNQDWHFNEFHGTKCSCELLPYSNFEEYIKFINDGK